MYALIVPTVVPGVVSVSRTPMVCHWSICFYNIADIHRRNISAVRPFIEILRIVRTKASNIIFRNINLGIPSPIDSSHPHGSVMLRADAGVPL